jgi:hypothetical protein
VDKLIDHFDKDMGRTAKDVPMNVSGAFPKQTATRLLQLSEEESIVDEGRLDTLHPGNLTAIQQEQILYSKIHVVYSRVISLVHLIGYTM